LFHHPWPDRTRHRSLELLSNRHTGTSRSQGPHQDGERDQDTFRDALSIKAATWNAVFLIGAGLTFVWLVRAVVWRVKAPSVDDLMDKFKKPE